jgi:hypothetical protein
MRFTSRLTIFLIPVVALSIGCATRKPFRSLSPAQRGSPEIVNLTHSLRSEYSTANSRALDSTGEQSGLLGVIVFAIPSAWIEGKGAARINEIRAKSGIDEGDAVAKSVSQRVHLLEPKNGDATPGAVLEIGVTRAGIAELER